MQKSPPEMSSEAWRSPNNSFSSSSSSGSGSDSEAETVIFRDTKMPLKNDEAFVTGSSGLMNELSGASNLLNEANIVSNVEQALIEVDVDSNAIDVTDDGKEKLELNEVNLFVVSYEELTNNNEMSFPIYDKVKASWAEASKAKKKLMKMFDFLEKQESITGGNKEKIIRQKVRVSEMIDNWMSICKDFFSDCDNFKNCNFVGGALNSVSTDGYMKQVCEERFNYRAESVKWNQKFCLAMSEVRRLQQEVIAITRNQGTVKRNGFHKRTLRSSNAIEGTSASLDVVNKFDYENMTANCKVAEIKGQYEAQLVAAEQVHKSLEEQNQLLCAQMALLLDHNKMLVNRCQLLMEENGSQFEEQKAIRREITVCSKEINVSGKNTLMLAEEELESLECKNPILSNSETEVGGKIAEYQYKLGLLQKEYAILHSKLESVESDKNRDVEKEISKLKCELEKSKELTELYRTKAEDAESLIADLSVNQKKIENELQKSNDTIEGLRSQVKGLQDANIKLEEHKKSSVEILTSIRNLEKNLHQQKIETDKLLLQAQERKDEDKYRYYSK